MKIDFNKETIYVTQQEIETFNVLKENIKEQQSYLGEVNLKEFNIVLEATESTCYCYEFNPLTPIRTTEPVINPYLTQPTCNAKTDIT